VDFILFARFEVFTAMTMKNAVFWDATTCGSCKNPRIGITYHLHHQGGKNLRAHVLNLGPRWWELSFTLRPILPWLKRLVWPLDRFCELQSRSGYYGEDPISVATATNRNLIPRPPEPVTHWHTYGAHQTESLGFWTLSAVWDSKN
jgi:hypothetical protein